MALFPWWHREDVLIQACLCHRTFFHLPFPSCLVAPLCFVLASQHPLSSTKWHIYPTLRFFVRPFWHRQTRLGTNARFSSGCIQHRDAPASAKTRQFDSIISVSNMLLLLLLLLPALLVEIRCFYIAGEDRMTGNEPMCIIHNLSTFFLTIWSCFIEERGEDNSQGLVYTEHWGMEQDLWCAAFKVGLENG